MTGKNIRIKDIAHLAGVSVGTVDRVLHNRGRVSDDALKKVLEVLEQIDYKPNLIARTLGSNKLYRIAILSPNPEQDPYWSATRSGISLAQAEWLRYNVKLEQHYFDLYDKHSLRQAAEEVTDSEPDGILAAPIFYQESLPFLRKFEEKEIPYVLFNTNIPEARPLSFIGQNLYQSGRLAAELMHMACGTKKGFYIVLHYNEDLQNAVHLAEKERGFREYFENGKTNHVRIETLNLNSFDSLDALLPDAHGIFITTSKGTYLVADHLTTLKNSAVRIVGYDMLKENIEYMKKGVIDFLINQNPKRQAFLGISHLVNALVLRQEPAPEDLLPLEIITRENLDSYLNSLIH